ncbi:YtxH domain-containing protein [Ferruginibacter albus]|uniref:YtxH domain-containing protein n=1 Tax=Ferruginibacter albus TaxID=2875540 RepID=UPI001CC4C944|nr:YtxH domain-containing protein [Ferruginibacter albus]UAY52867.1 YtxH domain-containing protein [Ferruginibacter albus]
MNSKKIIAGIVIGTAIGILIAPRKGSETRKKIAGSVNDIADFIEDKINAIRQEVHSEVDAVADQITNKVENAESKINEALT